MWRARQSGNLNFGAKGTREEIIAEIMKAAETWGKPMATARLDGSVAKVVALGPSIAGALALMGLS